MKLKDLMEFLPYIIAFFAAILFPLLFSKRKKGARSKFQVLANHLQGIGVGFYELDRESEEAKLAKKLVRGQKLEGIVAVEKRKISFIMVTSLATQYGTNYFIEYLVKSTFMMREGPVKKTKMVKKRESFFGRRVVDVVWKGDQYLAQKLNLDYELKHRLLQADLSKFKSGILIIPAIKQGFTRIKTSYSLPAYEIFTAIDSIVHHL